MNEEKGLLHPALRGVIDKHVVPTNRCRMMRYTLSRVCRALWKRLRCERFLQFAAVVSGHMSLDASPLYEDLTFREECVRFIWPNMGASVDLPDPVANPPYYQVLWGGCEATSYERSWIPRGEYIMKVRHKLDIVLPLVSIKDYAIGRQHDCFPCGGRACCNSTMLEGGPWYLQWDSREKRVILSLDFRKRFYI